MTTETVDVGVQRILHAIYPTQYESPDPGHDCNNPEEACLTPSRYNG